MSVTVSMISFNTKDLTKNLVSQLLEQDYKGRLEIVVIDNNSSDGSAELLEEEFKGEIKVIKNEVNLGFAIAQNQILKNIKTDFAVVLNPDTSIPKNLISAMIKFMDENAKCGVASCKILGFDGVLHSNGGDFPEGLALYSWLFNLEVLGVKKNFHRSEKPYFEKPHKVDWVGGTFMIIRKEVLEKTGGFNEDYFMYFEDVEFCYLVNKKGFEVWINPAVEIKHKSGASSDDPNFKQWCGEFKGVINFYKKTGFIE